MTRTRRGAAVLASDLRKQVSVFEPGDIVTSVLAGSIDFIGQVTRIDTKCSKVFVNWGDGTETQQSPDEIQLYPVQCPDIISKMLVAKNITRRGRFVAEVPPPSGDQFVGDPKQHGIDKPIGGGFSIMQNLVKKQRKEIKEEAEAGPKIAPQQADMGTDEEIAGDQNAPGGDQNAPQEAPEDAEAALMASLRSRRASFGDEALLFPEKGEVVLMERFDPPRGATEDEISESEILDDTISSLRRRAKKISALKGFRVKSENYQYKGGKWYGMLVLKGRSFDLDEMSQKMSPDWSGILTASLISRRALYWGDKGRVYRMTRREQQEGVCNCPRCREQMEKEPFTKKEKLMVCPGCGFKIPTSKLVDKKIEIEISPDGSVEVEVEPVEGSRRARSLSAAMFETVTENRQTA